MFGEIPWVKVTSSWIDAVAYVPGSRYLFVRTIAGVGYVFHRVPPEVAEPFMTAESMGTYFNTFLKPKFHHERIM